jgi:hypothetical protein
MLKTPASFVLASLRPSTYLELYASALRSLRPCWTSVLTILHIHQPLLAQSFLLPIENRFGNIKID